jgi:hypothetical protein
MASSIQAMAAEHHTVLVLDYGSQYTQLIARRVREIGMFSVLFPGDAGLVSNGSVKHGRACRKTSFFTCALAARYS